jgi:hypothetical protein
VELLQKRTLPSNKVIEPGKFLEQLWSSAVENLSKYWRREIHGLRLKTDARLPNVCSFGTGAPLLFVPGASTQLRDLPREGRTH